jgi:4-hydroxy-3-methylbut-2-en-1-yl diphosphate reductase
VSRALLPARQGSHHQKRLGPRRDRVGERRVGSTVDRAAAWLYTLHCKEHVYTNIRDTVMRIIRAASLGMCFGVRDAIALALGQIEAGPLTILGDLVHNTTVLAALRAKGIAFAHEVAQVKTHAVMVTAHGASKRTLANTRALGLDVVEATCPLVRVAHRAVMALVRDGYHPVIIGQRAHVEVRGLTEDLNDFDVVLDEGDVLELHEHARIGVAAQTTQPIERVRHLVALIRRHFPRSDVRFIDTVCQPTKQRQNAALELARQCDVVIVIGGTNSNNTRELVHTCSLYCSHVHHVQTESDLRPEWFDAAGAVGITAGTSTPDPVIDSIEQRIRELAAEQGDHPSDTAQGDR